MACLAPLFSRTALAPFALVAMFVAAAPHSACAMTASVTATSIEIAGATPGGRVAVARYGLAQINGVSSLIEFATVATVDRAGAASVVSTTPAPNTLWLAVDLSNNDYVTAFVPGTRPALTLAGPLVRSDFRTLEIARPLAFVTLVRPHVGLWQSAAGDGADGDDDHAGDHRLTFAASQFHAVGTSAPAPPVFTPGDTIFAFDPAWSEYTVFRIPAGGPNAH